MKSVLPFQVTGTLKPKNVHVPPYQPVCMACEQRVFLTHTTDNDVVQCATCATTTKFQYKQFLQCTIHTTNGDLNCYLHKQLLENNFPQLAAIPYLNYKNGMSAVMFMLHKFQLQGTFTLSMDNCIIEIVKQDNAITPPHSWKAICNLTQVLILHKIITSLLENVVFFIPAKEFVLFQKCSKTMWSTYGDASKTKGDQCYHH